VLLVQLGCVRCQYCVAISCALRCSAIQLAEVIHGLLICCV